MKIGKSSQMGSKYDRGSSCRYDFLRKHKGLFRSGIYCCSYCGKLITKRGLQVDHCVPVDKAVKGGFIRHYIRIMGIFSSDINKKGINGSWNLVAACGKCNGRKKAKGGLWIIRGIIGRYLFPIIWYGVSIVTVLTFLQFLATGQGIWKALISGLQFMLSKLSALGGIL